MSANLHSHDAWVVAFPEEKVGQDVVKLASRLMPRSVIHNSTLRNQLVDAIKHSIDLVSRLLSPS